MNKLSPQQIHEAKEFLSLFESIPAERWCKHEYHLPDNRYCAQGHLAMRGRFGETDKLNAILGMDMTTVNDAPDADARTNVLTALKKAIDGA